MLLNAKKIIGLPVETNNGTKVGKVADINLDIDSHIVNSYAIKGGFISNENLLIGRTQVVSISNKKMTIEDGAIREKIESSLAETLTQKTEPALTATSK
jgi:sporulation protein YlmC with PRC-barrel domain